MSLTVKTWSSVAIAIQSALASAITITGITKANPGVVTYTGTDPSNGDFLVFTVTGMSELDGRVIRAANVNAGGNTLELEGVDTTSFGTFATGSAQVITFGTTLITATDMSASGGDFDFIDTTTIHDAVKTQIPGAASPSQFQFNNIWDVADAGLIALKAASDLKAKRAVKITFAGPYIAVFNGYIGATLLPTGNAQDKVTTPVTITMHGRPTYYSS